MRALDFGKIPPSLAGEALSGGTDPASAHVLDFRAASAPPRIRRVVEDHGTRPPPPPPSPAPGSSRPPRHPAAPALPGRPASGVRPSPCPAAPAPALPAPGRSRPPGTRPLPPPAAPLPPSLAAHVRRPAVPLSGRSRPSPAVAASFPVLPVTPHHATPRSPARCGVARRSPDRAGDGRPHPGPRAPRCRPGTRERAGVPAGYASGPGCGRDQVREGAGAAAAGRGCCRPPRPGGPGWPLPRAGRFTPRWGCGVPGGGILAPAVSSAGAPRALVLLRGPGSRGRVDFRLEFDCVDDAPGQCPADDGVGDAPRGHGLVR